MGGEGDRHEAAVKAAALAFLVANAPIAAAAEDIYAGVGPATYCLWNRTGLPRAQQGICEQRDRGAPPYQPIWKKFEADNGAVFQVDVNSVQRIGAGVLILVYSVEGVGFNPQNMRRLWFDCEGHYRDETGAIGPTLYAQPRSVVGRISEIACLAAK